VGGDRLERKDHPHDDRLLRGRSTFGKPLIQNQWIYSNDRAHSEVDSCG